MRYVREQTAFIQTLGDLAYLLGRVADNTHSLGTDDRELLQFYEDFMFAIWYRYDAPWVDPFDVSNPENWT